MSKAIITLQTRTDFAVQYGAITLQASAILPRTPTHNLSCFCFPLCVFGGRFQRGAAASHLVEALTIRASLHTGLWRSQATPREEGRVTRLVTIDAADSRGVAGSKTSSSHTPGAATCGCTTGELLQALACRFLSGLAATATRARRPSPYQWVAFQHTRRVPPSRSRHK